MYAASFLSGMIGSGGDLKAGLISMASAGLAKYIGHGTFSAAAKGGASPFGAFKPIAHGVSQGAMTKLRGGRFKDGFLGAIIAPIAGGLTKNVLSSTFNTTNVTMQKIIAITAGGVGAKAAGGSFQSGAMSAAFVYLYNHGDTSQHTHRTQKEEIQFIKTQKAFGLLDYHMEQHGYQGGNLDLEDAIILQIEITPFKDYLKLGINMLSTYTGPMGPIESLKSLPELKQMTNDKHIYLYSFPNGRDPIVTRK